MKHNYIQEWARLLPLTNQTAYWLFRLNVRQMENLNKDAYAADSVIMSMQSYYFFPKE